MMRPWQRVPVGKAMQAIGLRRQVMNAPNWRRDVFKLTEEEFVAALRDEKASEHLIAQELSVWRASKASYDSAQEEALRRRRARERAVDEDLEEYLAAETRRQGRKA